MIVMYMRRKSSILEGLQLQFFFIFVFTRAATFCVRVHFRCIFPILSFPIPSYPILEPADNGERKARGSSAREVTALRIGWNVNDGDG